MSAFSFRQVFNPEKPHSSITDWVDILTVSGIEEEAYDGIPELVESINLQGGTGPAEASRALRKKLKHGTPHQQYRALVILKALVENCGDRFRQSFADNQLIDAFRAIAADSYGDKKVQKKLKLVLLSWQDQFKSDPSMKHVADLYLIIKESRRGLEEALYVQPVSKAEKEEARRKKEEARERERERLRNERKKKKSRGQPFNFETEKLNVLASIAEASQASSNLVNAITLVNTEKESVLTNVRVQDCLEIAKQVRKNIVRYIQLVENEEMIGVLIETNDRIITALDMYDQAQAALEEKAETKDKDITAGLAKIHLGGSTGELARLQDQQRVEVEKAKYDHPTSPLEAHPDLQDLDFSASSSKLPPPIRPTSMGDHSSNQGGGGGRGSLSDFSDYESSDEEAHNNRAWSGSEHRKDYITVSDDSDDARVGIRGHAEDENPFADPFADQVTVGSSKHM